MPAPSIPTTQRALVANSDLNDWDLKEQHPLPAYDDLLVKVHAVALNPTDWKHVHLKWLKPGVSTGSDFSGVVVDSKANSQYKVGERVAGFTRGGVLHQDNGAFAGKYAYAHIIIETLVYNSAQSTSLHRHRLYGVFLRILLSSRRRRLVVSLPTPPSKLCTLISTFRAPGTLRARLRLLLEIRFSFGAAPRQCRTTPSKLPSLQG